MKSFIFLLFFSYLTIEAYPFSIRIASEASGRTPSSKLTCVGCLAGSFSGSFSVDGKPYNCSQYCPLGSCPIGISCTNCSTGTYSDQNNSSKCLPCGVGEVSQVGAVNCTSCGMGQTNNEDSSSCILCTAGYFNDHLHSSCRRCPVGQFSNISGATKCADCPSGSYNPLRGQPNCLPCGIGYYNPFPTAITQAACLICPGGYYCPYGMTSTPEPCPENSFCPAGASGPRQCPLLFQSEKASENCQPKATLYLLLLASVAALVILVSVIICIRAGKNKSGPESKTKQPTESERLIPPPRDGPVYEGL